MENEPMTKVLTEKLQEQMELHLQDIMNLYDMYETALSCEDDHEADEAREEALSYHYSVQVRSDWQRDAEEFDFGEFRIVLSGSGPYIHIHGWDKNDISIHGIWHATEHNRELVALEQEAVCWIVRLYMPELDGVL